MALALTRCVTCSSEPLLFTPSRLASLRIRPSKSDDHSPASIALRVAANTSKVCSAVMTLLAACSDWYVSKACCALYCTASRLDNVTLASGGMTYTPSRKCCFLKVLNALLTLSSLDCKVRSCAVSLGFVPGGASTAGAYLSVGVSVPSNKRCTLAFN